MATIPHSTVPRAVANLYAMSKETFDPLGVYVVDSATDTWAPEEVFVVASQITGAQEWRALGRRRREDDYDIECGLYVRLGDNDLAARRDRLFYLFGLLEQMLSDDPTLRGAVRVAAPTNFVVNTGFQTQQAKGSASEMMVSIHVNAPILNQGVSP
jgi:hypothetical protein